MGLIEDARAVADARPVRRIDYDRMNKVFPKQKAALTRAVNAVKAICDEPGHNHTEAEERAYDVAIEKVAQTIKAATTEWNEIGAWPDDWARWQRAIDDLLPLSQQVDIRDL